MLRSPPTPFEGLMNYAPDQRDMDRLNEQFSSNETQPSTNWIPQTPRNEQPYPKLYLVKSEEGNLDNDFGYESQISKTISEQLKKRVQPEKKIKAG